MLLPLRRNAYLSHSSRTPYPSLPTRPNTLSTRQSPRSTKPPRPSIALRTTTIPQWRTSRTRRRLRRRVPLPSKPSARVRASRRALICIWNSPFWISPFRGPALTPRSTTDQEAARGSPRAGPRAEAPSSRGAPPAQGAQRRECLTVSVELLLCRVIDAGPRCAPVSRRIRTRQELRDSKIAELHARDAAAADANNDGEDTRASVLGNS